MSYLTHAQASEMWCPFGRLAVKLEDETGATGIAAANRTLNGDGTRCLTTGCMAWRGIPSDNGESKIEGIRRRRAETGCTLVAAKDYVETHPDYLHRQASECGYCGIAGRPE
ncbi:hypothetical protein SB2_25530 [Methylobacterium radiotolerans]|nr:hypothetical protein SB3_28255 [Methylobacterium radiotolerans]KTS44099.1 hypothetical protein SB2_25530 [Methylobacterium radiotolerans]